ncbi:hypothetical protein EDP2_3916 [Enterobacter cloacae S611]|uniref:Uncharacterized protein n=1 Tax=Enterobacter cloacae S611 TaxID=1399146 RepID=A0ABN0QCY0_ENTCL|nr:hypothetical protein EDP2_3916 [Enterobacter cloacae S611]
MSWRRRSSGCRWCGMFYPTLRREKSLYGCVNIAFMTRSRCCGWGRCSISVEMQFTTGGYMPILFNKKVKRFTDQIDFAASV